jgi:SAM-dependent methyltransferase
VIAVLAAPPVRPDLRAAAARSRDAWRAGGEGLTVVEPDDPRAGRATFRLDVLEPEAAVAPGGLARAARILLASGASSVEPAGFWPGGPRPAEPYATTWEFEEVAAEPSGEPVLLARDAPAAPATLRLARGRGNGTRLATGAWTVHSFAGRRAHARPEVAALVLPQSRRILEIGCAEGALGASLEARGARVTGVEADAEAARVAATRLSRVVARPFDEALPSLEGGFDTVILADVLEHLPDPLAALLTLRALAAEGAVLVVSLPNASHAAVLGGALQGRWDLALEGVVADDHLTWAGGAGWRRLLEAGGWRVERAEPVRYASPRVAPWARALTASGLPASEAEAIQWLFVARRGEPGEPLDLGPRAADDAFRADPVAEARAALAVGRAAEWALPNAASGAALEALFAGGLVRGAGRAALTAGFTPKGLARRFAGAGLHADVALTGVAAPPTRVAAAADAARRAGLPVDLEALGAAGLRLRVRGEAR